MRRSRGTAFLLLAVLAAHLPAFRVPFQYDDLHTVSENAALREGDLRAVLSHIRPLTGLSLWLDRVLWGDRPAGFHGTALLLHGANVLLVRRLAGHFVGGPWALAAAAGFALHPLQVEAVAYVSGRADLLAAFFMLAGGCVFLGATRARPAVVCALGLAALLSKESGAVYPAWLLLLDGARARKDGAPLSRATHAWTFGTLAAAALLQALWAGEPHVLRVARLAGGWQATLGYVLSQLTALPKYLGLLGWPSGLSINHDVRPPFPAEGIDPSLPFSVGNLLASLARWWDGGCTQGLALLGLAALLMRLLAGPGWRWGLAGGWFLLQMLPTALVPLHDPFQEHRAYLALAGPFLGAALGAERLVLAGVRLAPLGGLAAAGLLFLGVGTFSRTGAWREGRTLWSGAVRIFPANPRAHVNLGVAWTETGLSGRAGDAYRRALAIEGRSDEMSLAILRNLFAREAESGSLAEADRSLAEIRRLAGGDPDRLLAVWGGARSGIDEALCRWAVRGGGPPEAVAWATRLVEAAAREDASPALQGNLGSLLALQGRWPEAAERFRSALDEHARRGGGRDTEVQLRVSWAQALAESGRPTEAASALAPVADDPRVAEFLKGSADPGR